MQIVQCPVYKHHAFRNFGKYYATTKHEVWVNYSITLAIVPYLTTCSGANSNQWLCQECNFSVFPFYIVSNEEFLREQNFSNDPTPIDYVSPNVNANLLNSWFCDVDNSEDENLHVSNQYIETFNLNTDEIANATSIPFRLLCLNIRSLANINNFSKLEAIVASLPIKLDIIAVTETWLKPSFTGPHKNLPGYNFVSNDRVVDRGGGIGLCIKNGITSSVRDDLTTMKEKNFESIFVNVKIDGKMITCGTIYRSPASEDNSHESFATDLNFCLSKLSPQNNCIVCGDFNYNLLASNDKHVNNFVDSMYEHGFI